MLGLCHEGVATRKYPDAHRQLGEIIMRLLKTGHRFVSVLAGFWLVGVVLVAPAVADTDPAGPAFSTVQTGQ
ncbi:hypothetical protein, partial [Streptomyces sp. NPDC006638]|uniref:hypothetical protein n=1 Tax=Streptomyces sp. NPDC006638 TaxID=3157183 RepID=UPI0033A2DA8E